MPQTPKNPVALLVDENYKYIFFMSKICSFLRTKQKESKYNSDFKHYVA